MRTNSIFELFHLGKIVSEQELIEILKQEKLKLFFPEIRDHKKIEDYVAGYLSSTLPIVFAYNYYIISNKIFSLIPGYVEEILRYKGERMPTNIFWGANVHFAVLPQ